MLRVTLHYASFKWSSPFVLLLDFGYDVCHLSGKKKKGYIVNSLRSHQKVNLSALIHCLRISPRKYLGLTVIWMQEKLRVKTVPCNYSKIHDYLKKKMQNL